jgi:predicted DNA-binding WGR domain protein/DNA polymerase III delta prime subunit
MSGFGDFLQVRLEGDGFSTEDVLASVLPLMRQVMEAHGADMVAPLDGLDKLRVEGAAIWFEESARTQPTTNSLKLRQLDRPAAGAIEVVAEQHRTVDVDRGITELKDLRIAEAEDDISRPVYLPGYVTWEHAIGHHDPMADVFSLGMILASLACGLDFREPRHLQAFVTDRENLFRLNAGLHPVLAKAIVNMTELSRHRRPQDLRALMRNLETYRDQEVSFEFDLASIKGFGEKDLQGKQQIILNRLQERLFEISRRNRLLHFRDTAGTVCLTEASVPLSFAVENVRQDQILTWSGRFRNEMSAGKRVSLNEYMNFREALYLAPTLDRIRAESLRDQAEFGFQQLRVVLCFLRWADVKSKPPEPYYSPLVLIAAKLVKKKGVRDTYHIEPLSTVAEINPVLRHMLKQLYDINLPETIDLAEATLEDLYEGFRNMVESSDASVTVKKIERPRIDLIHEKARRRLDMYRRRARLSGRGLRRFMDLDYSYDLVNFHPLGLRLFNAWIRPAETHLHAILQERPGPRHFFAATPEPPVSVKERRLYALRDGDDGNPYAWEFDLCRVTLGNFRYRKMSLVRDYTELLEKPRGNVAFDATFSLSPKIVESEQAKAPPLEQRFDIVACDPTQAAAIGLARMGKSYIIQGPPGTGKSQTITNLIADYVARGKRVLFVCEKRAAIDVVYSRLKQRGLQELCCLIHDSQADKREFVLDLKQTYESFVKAASEGHHRFARRRKRIDTLIEQESKQLGDYARAMLSTPEEAGTSIQNLLQRGAQLGIAVPSLPPLEMERVPFYVHWVRNPAAISSLIEKLGRVQDDLVLARHPLRLFSARLHEVDRPLEQVTEVLDEAEPLLEKAIEALDEAELTGNSVGSLRAAVETAALAAEAHLLARQELLGILNSESQAGKRFAQHMRKYEAAQATLEEAREATANWRDKFPATAIVPALDEARRLERSLLSFLRPSWWRLRRVLQERYDFGADAVRPTWSQVLTNLQAEYDAAEALKHVDREMRDSCAIEEDLEAVVACVGKLRDRIRDGDGQIQALLALPRPDEAVRTLAALEPDLLNLQEILGEVFQDYEDAGPEQLLDNLMAVRESLDDVPDFLTCLADLAAMPSDLAAGFRHLDLTPREMEAASVRRTLDAVYRSERSLRTLDQVQRERSGKRVYTAHKTWLDINTQVVRERIRSHFIEDLRVASLPAAQLSREQSEFKKRFNRGRRDLEHEFGKSMRYKPIRDLVADESGMVIDDLKPIWLMSPLSVSDTLPLEEGRFDVVIFDEASQITLEEAVPALFRAGQAIVVGDEMQLPPTNFFSAKQVEEDATLWLEEGDEIIEYDLSINSFLSHASKNLPSRMLGWHYRSRSESLISFSNWAFYQGGLLTVPEEEVSVSRRPEIVVKDPAEGETGYRELLARAVSFHSMEGAVYKNRRNRGEAEYIAHMLRALLADAAQPSIGIVAFSEAQQTEIEEAVEQLAGDDAAFRERLETELTREEDGQFIGLLVKNLENIQGDERDVIILSVCYGHGPDGQMRMNFGPINQSGGEKRLNVAFSRAKHHMAVVSSIQHFDITNDYNDGANCLKNYLRYAAACSLGDDETAARILRELCLWRDPGDWQRAGKPSAIARQIGEAMAQHGYHADYAVGMSDFRCDLALRRDGEETYRLGILVDADPYYRQGDLLEREVFKPQLLTAFGWHITRVLSKDWYENRDGTLRRILAIAQGETPPEKIELDPAFAEALEAKLAECGNEGPAPSPTGIGEEAEHAPPLPGSESGGILDVHENRPRYFELIGGSSKKFWEITFSGERFSVRFGRIGTSGQERVKSYADRDAAQQAAERMISQKIAKGYEEKPRSKDNASVTNSADHNEK